MLSKFHPTVTALYYLSRLLGKSLKTPHLYGGTDAEKRQYEYNQGDLFFREAGIDPKILEGRSVIDIGCGYGGKAIYYSEHFKPGTMVAIDTRVSDGEVLENCHIYRGDAHNIEHLDEVFDIVMMEDVLEHVLDPLGVLMEAYRVLEVGGVAIIKFPSIKSIVAHHFDRICMLPGIHLLWSFKTLVEGFNHILQKKKLGFEPFADIAGDLPRNLNGLTLRQFQYLAQDAGFKTLRCECIPYWHFRGEVMSKTIIYVGVK